MKVTDLMNEIFNADTASQTIDNIEAQIAGLKKGMPDIQASEKEKAELQKKVDQLTREKQIALAKEATAKAKQGIQRIPITKATTPVQMAQVSARAEQTAQA